MEDTKETKIAFAASLSGAYVALGKEAPKPEIMAMFFDLLREFDISQVQAALRAHLRDTARGHMPPVVADIIRHIPGRSRFPGANEAWAIGLRSTDEQISVCWCQEIASAMGSAQPILNAGDEIGARMAFIETYRRLVAESEAAGKQPLWSMSYGDNPHLRIDAERRAVAAGLLPAPQRDQARIEGPDEAEAAEKTRQRLRDLAATVGLKMTPLTDRQREEIGIKQSEDFEVKKKSAIEMIERMKAREGTKE